MLVVCLVVGFFCGYCYAVMVGLLLLRVHYCDFVLKTGDVSGEWKWTMDGDEGLEITFWNGINFPKA